MTMPSPDTIEPDRLRRAAVISPCGAYRYWLERVWSDQHVQPFVLLNPSTADASIDDPTIRRCMEFAKREGRGGIVVVNLYALRATNQKQLKIAKNPIGPENDSHISDMADWAARAGVPVICSWGTHAARSRADKVMRLMEHLGAKMVCLGRTAGGDPKHPLYVKGDQPLEQFA